MFTQPTYHTVRTCRICGSRELTMVLALGETPLANAFIRPQDRETSESRFPLELLRCAVCGLVQLSVVVRPEILFRHYLYASSASPPIVSHFEAYADEVARRFAPPSSLVVEIGSNDGVLLRPLRARGLQVLGIEPATNLARAANAVSLETWNEFFAVDVARRIAAERGPANAVLANNVLAHIDDLEALLRGLDVLLDDRGVFVAEFPYLRNLIENVEYDTIYHEHLSYFSLAPLERLFARVGMELFDIKQLPIHGGSLRIFVGRAGRHAATPAVEELRGAEARAGLADPAVYERFAACVRESREALRDLLLRLRGAGKRVAALGATAKGNTLLNYCGIGPEVVEYVADSTPLKQGLLTPGMRIPVRPERVIRDDRPDFTLLLAWNYAEAIVERFGDYIAAGGRFIHPIPLARVMPS